MTEHNIGLGARVSLVDEAEPLEHQKQKSWFDRDVWWDRRRRFLLILDRCQDLMDAVIGSRRTLVMISIN
jgi:hypothetical protein